MLKLRKTIEKTSISIHLENFDMEETVWSYSWSSEAIHNQPPAQGFSASRNSIWLETYLSDMHPCQSHGRVCAQQAYGPNSEKLDSSQYAREGHSTTDALIYILQVIHEVTDSGNFGARMFFMDYSKGFDLIDH